VSGYAGCLFAPDLPDGLFDRPSVQPCLQKYRSFHLTQITGLSRAIPFPIEGRFAIVTDVGFGMRWMRQRARRTMLLRTAKPCGPDAPTLAFTSRRRVPRLAGHGGNKARSPGRARSKPLKPLRRECRGSGEPVVTNSRVFHTTRGRGCNGHPALPAPSLEGRAAPSILRRRRLHSKLAPLYAARSRAHTRMESYPELTVATLYCPPEAFFSECPALQTAATGIRPCDHISSSR